MRRKRFIREDTQQAGPGSPDYVKGRRRGEVKRWSRPVDRSTLIKLRHKGINEVVSKKGSTELAKEFLTASSGAEILGEIVSVRIFIKKNSNFLQKVPSRFLIGRARIEKQK